MKKIIPHVYPFDDMYYNNCFYSALFPIIRHFGGSIAPLLLSRVLSYRPAPEWMALENIRDYDDCYKAMGIKKTSIPKSDDIVGYIKETIDNDRLSMIFIDCFYQKLRPDAYNKYHWTHIILPYGYDDEEGVFHILEHSYIDGFMYQRYKMDYDQMKNCYENFVKNPHRNGIIEFEKEHEVDVAAYQLECQKDFCNIMLSHKEETCKNIDAILSQLYLMKETNSTESCLNDFDKNIYETADQLWENIIKIKQCERYAFVKALDAPKELIDLFDKTIMGMMYIPRAIHSRDNIKVFQAALQHIIHGFESEKNFWDKAFLFLDEKSKEKGMIPLDISEYLNNDNLQVDNNSYQLFNGKIFHLDMVPFIFPEKTDGINNNILTEGQYISFKKGVYKKLHFLAFADFDCREDIILTNDGETVGKTDLFLHYNWTGSMLWKTDIKDSGIKNIINFRTPVDSVRGANHYAASLPECETDGLFLPLVPAIQIIAITLEW